MTPENIIGYVAAFLTTVAFLPQTIKVIYTKDTKSLSLIGYSLFFVGVLLWEIYGILNEQYPIIIANIITAILTFIILFYKIKDLKNS